MSSSANGGNINRPVGVAAPIPRLPATETVYVNNRVQVDYNSSQTDTDNSGDSDSDYEYFPQEVFHKFPQQSANDQESSTERNYIKMSPSVTIPGVFHDRRKGWQFSDLLAYIDFDQDVNVITKHFLLSKGVPHRFIKLDINNKVKVAAQLIINHEVFHTEFFVIDEFVHRKPVVLSGSRWRNVRQLKLAHNYRENGDKLFGAILGYKFFSFINLNKIIHNDASLLIQETKLGYIVSGRCKKTDSPINLFDTFDDNDSDIEEYNPNKPRNPVFISVETGSTFYPCDIMNYQGPRTFTHRRPRLHDHLFRDS